MIKVDSPALKHSTIRSDRVDISKSFTSSNYIARKDTDKHDLTFFETYST